LCPTSIATFFTSWKVRRELFTKISKPTMGTTGHHASMAEEDLREHGLEPETSLVTLTKRVVCTQCGSRAVAAYRYEEDDLGPTLVPRE
jgi:hypothetical protein